MAQSRSCGNLAGPGEWFEFRDDVATQVVEKKEVPFFEFQRFNFHHMTDSFTIAKGRPYDTPFRARMREGWNFAQIWGLYGSVQMKDEVDLP